jgi:prophage DNA circulation protein
LIDLKANATDVFKVFDEIRRSVDIVSSKQASFEQTKSFNELLNQQKVINHNFTSSGNIMSNLSETQRSATSTSHGGQFNIPQQIQNIT